jgi:preprotein translocase subunit SecG
MLLADVARSFFLNSVGARHFDKSPGGGSLDKRKLPFYSAPPFLHIPRPHMSIVINILLAINVLVSLLIILLVLMQRPKSEGLGAAFGGGMTENIFGAGTTNALQTITRYLGGIFFCVTLMLSWLYIKQSSHKSSVQQRLMAPSVVPAPAATPSPNAKTPAAPSTPPASADAAKATPAAPAPSATPASAPAAPSAPPPATPFAATPAPVPAATPAAPAPKAN